jgi:hypothetical protein
MRAVGYLVLSIDGSDDINVPVDVDTSLIEMRARYGNFVGDTYDPEARRFMEYLLSGIGEGVQPHILHLTGD